jgi:hypothetical protein
MGMLEETRGGGKEENIISYFSRHPVFLSNASPHKRKEKLAILRG